jgi:hypothetical protein
MDFPEARLILRVSMDSGPGLLAVAWGSSNTKNTRSRIVETSHVFAQYFFKEVIIIVSPENWIPT